MLGLLSAGAGAYTLFRDKPPSKEGDSGSGKSSPGSAGPGGGTNARGDRGKEIPVSQSGGAPTSPSSAGSPQGSGGGTPAPSSGAGLGSEDARKHKEQFPGLRKKPKLDLKNKVDDIIRNNSKFANHRRPLINAEALVDKESYNGALEIYKRTKGRVPDEEIQGKIQENIDQIENHLESDEEEVYRPENYDGPPIPLGDLVRAIKDISESLGDTISKGFGNPISLPLSPMDPGAIPGPPTLPGNLTPGPVSYHIFSPGPALPPGSIPPPSPGSPGGAPTSFIPSFPGGGGSSGGGGGASGGGGAGIPGEAGVGSPGSSGGGGSGGGASAGGSGSPGGGGGFPGGSGGGSAGSPSSGGGSPGARDSGEHLDPNAMDLPEDTFFSEEWEKFKDLPLVDRRTGESRRSGGDRRGQDPNRKDRRDGDDRRREDLFKLRDEYLKQKEEQKKKEREEAPPEESAPELSDYDWPDAPQRDDLPPFLAPVVPKIELVPILLPDPTDKTVRPEEEPPKAPSPSPLGELKFDSLPAPSEGLEKEVKPLELPDIGLPDPEYQKTTESTPEIPHLAPASSQGEEQAPEIEVLEGGLEPFDEQGNEEGGEESGGSKDEEPRMIHGILELKPPEVDDAPFLTLTYDFGKIPHAFKLSKNYSIMEYSYYKYKPMLVKAQEFARRKMLKNALNYYRVIKSQNIPPELRKMINRNIKDITEFMEKYLMAKGG
ncbi:hypothetical protein A0128_13780 [Leptospira tipperaryensis]|uniref:Uncharacterized protein n=1 Tax=Leptospira tipperaryensis TaxID=2564040 RepID=A0A1D7V2Q0_9LEPT|nr:hypothetical protein [Leptospira tipperaryensis]AOP36084.1 hypothetical protein A0128_13780 [Leptospira tipperaryensis]